MSIEEPGALVGLPPVIRALIPELWTAQLPEESQADCGNCPMVAPAPEPADAGTFHRDARCCTYHPVLPNHAVGRALQRGGQGARRLRARIAEGDGVQPLGIVPSHSFRRRYAQQTRSGAFGTDIALRCPYWRGGELACSIWEDREAVCRTWFCRHDQGPRGEALWLAAREALRTAERALARVLVERGRSPDPGDPLRRWTGWYRWCARAAADLREDQLLAAEREALHRVRAELRRALERRDAPMPALLGPSVRKVERRGERVRLRGTARHQSRELPADIFALLSRLDGQTPWPEALAAAEAELDRPLGRALVEDLYNAGLLESREDPQRASPGMRLSLEVGGQRGHVRVKGMRLPDLLPLEGPR